MEIMVTATINFAIATGRLEDKRMGTGESNDEQSESEWEGHQRAKGQMRRETPLKF